MIGKRLKNTGLDDIPPKILKLLPDTTLGALAHIFNLSFVLSKIVLLREYLFKFNAFT